MDTFITSIEEISRKEGHKEGRTNSRQRDKEHIYGIRSISAAKCGAPK
jgi:hypothetical protein